MAIGGQPKLRGTSRLRARSNLSIFNFLPKILNLRIHPINIMFGNHFKAGKLARLNEMAKI